MQRSALPKLSETGRPAGWKASASEEARKRFDPSIRAAAKGEGEIEILGDIGESWWTDNFTTARMVKDALKPLGKAPVLVTINSPGGDVFEGIAMYNLLREHPGAVTVQVIGMAASAASVVMMAGDKVQMGKGAMTMIHCAWSGMSGNASDLREFADVLDAIDQSIVGLYAARTGMKDADILALMKKETWMSADQSIKDGFADSMMADKVKAKAAVRQPVYLRGKPAAKSRIPGAVYL